MSGRAFSRYQADETALDVFRRLHCNVPLLDIRVTSPTSSIPSSEILFLGEAVKIECSSSLLEQKLIFDVYQQISSLNSSSRDYHMISMRIKPPSNASHTTCHAVFSLTDLLTILNQLERTVLSSKSIIIFRNLTPLFATQKVRSNLYSGDCSCTELVRRVSMLMGV